MAGPFSQRWTLEEHTPRETGGMQGRQASVTFSRCLQANNISVLACPRYSLQAPWKLGITIHNHSCSDKWR
jgi:hypothetical protein